ncbi:MAG: RNA polymerase sigma factor [bacterium]|jgi:RNA polymerase sigma factor (sigma-70 family)
MTEREFNACVDAHADGVYRFILKNLGHVEDARDIVQSAFEKMWKNRGSVVNATAKSYLFTVAYHQMIDHIRKNKRFQFSEGLPEDIRVERSVQPGAQGALDKALEQLTPLQKSLVLLKDYEGYNYEEIGKIMALSESQVKVYLHRARLILRTYIGNPQNII